MDQRSREPAEELGLRLGGIEMAQGDQAVRPGEFEHAVRQPPVVVLLNQRLRSLGASVERIDG